MRINSKIYSISDFLSWSQKNELVLQPRFQRRDAWSPKARSFLIDSIVRGFPIPKIFIREQIDLETKSAIREVVDGQQRLRAILDFVSGQLTINKIHNSELAGKTFDDLDDELKKEFLSYPVSTDLLVGASDPDVLNVFSRINSYTLTLLQQETLNAEFFGPFKQLIYSLALEHYEFWVNNKILTDRSIARMGDAELVSEIVIGMLHGLQGGKAYIRKYYELYEESFPHVERTRTQFDRVIDLIAGIFPDGLAGSVYSRTPLFLSLQLAFFDVLFGFESGKTRPKTPIPSSAYASIHRELIELGGHITSPEPSGKFEALKNASARRTTNIRERTIRHRFFKEAISRGI